MYPEEGIIYTLFTNFDKYTGGYSLEEFDAGIMRASKGAVSYDTIMNMTMATLFSVSKGLSSFIDRENKELEKSTKKGRR